MLNKYKFILLILFIILLVGKLLYTSLRFSLDIPENLQEILQKQNNYILLPYNQLENWKNQYKEVKYQEYILQNNLLIEKYIYDSNTIDFPTLMKFYPIEFRIQNNSTPISVYFYKKWFTWGKFISLLYDSFLWTLSIIVMVLFMILAIYSIVYFLYYIQKLLKQYQIKKLSKEVL